MKRIIGWVLAVTMILSMGVSAYATGSADGAEIDEEEILRAISELDENFQNEEGCSSEVVSVEADENYYQTDEQMNGNTRGVNPPKNFYNIAKDGIYKASFTNLRGTMYTSKYFDVQNQKYYSPVRCSGEYARMKYRVGNYCITCKKVLSTTENDYYTPVTTNLRGDWVNIQHTVSSSHADHFMCPFVKNTNGLVNGEWYSIDGDIWVNYTNNWE